MRCRMWCVAVGRFHQSKLHMCLRLAVMLVWAPQVENFDEAEGKKDEPEVEKLD